MAAKNKQLRRWQFTLALKDDDPEDYYVSLLKALPLIGVVKYALQEEKGAGGLRHFGGNVSFKAGKRLSELTPVRFPGDRAAHWSATHDETATTFYNLKEDTRIRGPWTDKDKPPYVPVAHRDPVLKPSQVWLFNRLRQQNGRQIMFVVDKRGGTGKTWFGMHLAIHHKGVRLPSSLKSAQEMIQACMATLGSSPGESRFLTLDIPRSVSGNDSWIKWLSALEDIKNGHLCDPRYKWTEVFIEPPKMMVTCNRRPPQELLTGDRFDIVDMLWVRFASGELSRDEYKTLKAEEKQQEELRREKRRARETADKKTESEEEEDEEDGISLGDESEVDVDDE